MYSNKKHKKSLSVVFRNPQEIPHRKGNHLHSYINRHQQLLVTVER